MIDTLLMPFQFPFMQRAFLIALLVAPPTALISCFLVLKGWALMGDAISHAILPGVVLAYLAGLPLILGGFVAGMTCAVLTGYLDANTRLKSDTVMGVVFAGMFALGLVLFVAFPSSMHLDNILFGNMLGVDAAELRMAALIALVTCGALLLRWRDLVLYTFDPTQARASGLNVGVLHYGLLTLLSLTIISTLTATGLILAVGLVITPGAIAFLLVRSFGWMMAVSVLVCLVAMLGGVYASFFLDSAPGPTVIVVLTAMFVVAFGWKSWRVRRAQARLLH